MKFESLNAFLRKYLLEKMKFVDIYVFCMYNNKRFFMNFFMGFFMQRITISFPDENMDKLKEVLSFYHKKKENKSQSKVFEEAFKVFYKQFKKNKLRLQAQKMRKEYLNTPELNIFSDLDGESFHE